MNRGQCLDAARKAVLGEREQAYGSPAQGFARTAALWSAILGVEIKAPQVAACLAALKLARLSVTPSHEDSWVDLAGYAACGAEVSTRDEATAGFKSCLNCQFYHAPCSTRCSRPLGYPYWSPAVTK